MPKLPSSEDQVWALAYSVAASLLTLGSSIKSGVGASTNTNPLWIDLNAAEIADNAIKRFKKRGVV